MSDFIAPTPERLAKSSTWERPSDGPTTTRVANGREVKRHVKRAAYRNVSLVEVMHDGGELSSEQAEAFATFTRDMAMASRELYSQSKYGEVIHSSTEERLDRHGRPICPVARNVSARIRYRNAVQAVGMTHSAVISHIMQPKSSRVSVGVLFFGASSASGGARSRAGAKGREAIQQALVALAQHYGLIPARPT